MQGHFQHFNISPDCVKQTMCGLEEDRKLLQAERAEKIVCFTFVPQLSDELVPLALPFVVRFINSSCCTQGRVEAERQHAAQ